jgi:hypothetical protein
MSVATFFLLAAIAGAVLVLVELVYAYRSWRDVKLERAESTSHVKKRDAFELFALIWMTAAAACLLPTFFTFAQFGSGSDELHQAVLFGVIGGLTCVVLSMIMSRAAGKFRLLAANSLQSDREYEAFIGDEPSKGSTDDD